MSAPRIIKPKDQTTNEQRRQAMALIKSFPRDEKQDRRELVLRVGNSLFEIVIDRKIAA